MKGYKPVYKGEMDWKTAKKKYGDKILTLGDFEGLRKAGKLGNIPKMSYWLSLKNNEGEEVGPVQRRFNGDYYSIVNGDYRPSLSFGILVWEKEGRK